MKIAFIADIHASNHRQHGGQVVAGINQRGRVIVEALNEVAAATKKLGVVSTVVLGDLFDTVRPPPPLIAAVGRALQAMPGCQVLIGNHDRSSDAVDDHAASPIALSSSVAVYEQPTVRYIAGVNLVLVPFMPGPAREWLPAALAQLTIPKDEPNVLCLHLGIWDHHTPPFLKDAHDSVSIDLITKLVKQHNLCAVVAGNWHQRRKWMIGSVPVYICGTTCPVNHGDEKSDGAMLVLDVARDDNVSETLHTISGPRWATANGLAELQQVAPPVSGHLYVRSAVSPGEFAAATAIKTTLESSDSVSVNVTVDATTIRTQARKAAEVARSAESFDQVATNYLGEYPVRAPGTREGVAKRVAEYRRLAG